VPVEVARQVDRKYLLADDEARVCLSIAFWMQRPGILEARLIGVIEAEAKRS